MENFNFERAVVRILTETIDSQGKKHDAVARAAWPDRSAAGRTWQSIRNDSPPQKLTMRDAYGLAKQLGISLAAVCGKIEFEIAQKPRVSELPSKNEAQEEQKIHQGRPTQSAEYEASNEH